MPDGCLATVQPAPHPHLAWREISGTTLYYLLAWCFPLGENQLFRTLCSVPKEYRQPIMSVHSGWKSQGVVHLQRVMGNELVMTGKIS